MSADPDRGAPRSRLEAIEKHAAEFKRDRALFNMARYPGDHGADIDWLLAELDRLTRQQARLREELAKLRAYAAEQGAIYAEGIRFACDQIEVAALAPEEPPA